MTTVIMVALLHLVGDFAVVVMVFTVAVAAWWLLPWWSLPLIVPVLVIGWWRLRSWSKLRRQRRRMARRWAGTPESPGQAFALGLVNPAGYAPAIVGLRRDAYTRTVAMRFPVGIAVGRLEALAGDRSELAGAFGCVRVDVVATGPATCDLVLVDVDLMAESKAAEWVSQVESEDDDRAARMVDPGPAWWDSPTGLPLAEHPDWASAPDPWGDRT